MLSEKMIKSIQKSNSFQLENEGSSVLIFGAGDLGTRLADEYSSQVQGFLDSNSTKVGQKIEGKPVFGFQELLTISFDKIWISVLSDYESICYELRKLNLVEGEDFIVIYPLGKKLVMLDRYHQYRPHLLKSSVKGKRVLEVGCGSQFYFGLSLLWHGADSVILSDVIPMNQPTEVQVKAGKEFLEFLCSQYPKEIPAFEDWVNQYFRKLEHLDYPVFMEKLNDYDFGEQVDVVVNTGVMEHVSYPLKAIEGMNGFLKSGGKVFFAAIGTHDHRANNPRSVYTPWSFLKYSQAKWEQMEDNSYHQNRWRSIDFIQALKANNFEIESYSSTQDIKISNNDLLEMHEEFKRYTRNELEELNVYILARKIN